MNFTSGREIDNNFGYRLSEMNYKTLIVGFKVEDHID
jgi:hypothetical protein